MRVALVVVLSMGVLATTASPALAIGEADVSISISAPASVTANSPVTFTLKATNAGPDAARHVHVYDNLPPDVILSATSEGGTFDAEKNRVVWAEGTLPASSSVSEWVTLTPIHPGTVKDFARVTTSTSDPTTPEKASSEVTVGPEPGVKYVSVRDTGIAPSFRGVPLGDVVQWDFFGPSVHEISDAHGLGLLDSGPIAPVNYFRFSLDVSGEIRTQDLPAFPANTGKIVVPVQVSPASGSVHSSFTVTWALSAPPGGIVEDVQIKRPGESWSRWRHGESTLIEDTFRPDAGPGTYAFRSRLRDSTGDAESRFGPPVAIDVT
jgi:uncharacterized repeat protein (TIGR01451 family)